MNGVKEINHCGEGGLYAELIRNRAFQGGTTYPSSLDAWIPINGTSLSLKTLSTPLSSALPTSMNVRGATGKAGFTNLGFWGMSVQVQSYTGSFYVTGKYEGNFTASLQSNLTGEVFGTVEIQSESVASEWTQHNFTLTPAKAAPDSNNTFSITFDTEVSISTSSCFLKSDGNGRLTDINRKRKMASWISTSSVSSLLPGMTVQME